MKKKLIWAVVLIIAIIICIFCSFQIVLRMSSDGSDINQYKIGGENSTTSVDYAENHDIDWKKTQKKNSDIYSWIYIPNTNVDYPVCQASGGKEDDSFYLSHNTNKEYEFAGSIYSEMLNSKNYMDPVTVLYGHNMNNGSMFKTLHSFEDQKFFKKNKYIYIYAPQRKLTYLVYSAYVYDDRHILNSFDFSNMKTLKKYLKYTENPDSLTKNTRKVNLTINSKILTLSTCTNGAENTRYLVNGVLIKDEPTK